MRTVNCEDNKSVNPPGQGRLARVIADLKERLQARYEKELSMHPRAIREAIEEAEVIAWCTRFPHLFLPDLAEIRIANLPPGRGKYSAEYGDRS